MPQGYSKTWPGAGIDIPARLYNQLVDTAAGQDFDRESAPCRMPMDRTVCLVRNDSGADIGRFGVLGIDGVLVDPATNLREFQSRIMFSGGTPSLAGNTGNFVISIEPIAAGNIGRAIVSGVVQVQIAVPFGTPVLACAEVNDGDATKLANVASGSAQVLWAQQNAAAIQWAIVRLGPYRQCVINVQCISGVLVVTYG